MRVRPTPPAATWFLKLFCSHQGKNEIETVLGDLFEEYQYGRSAFWYWQQVLAIVVLRIYRQVPRLFGRRRPDGVKVASIHTPMIHTAAGASTWIPSVQHAPVRPEWTPLPGINSAKIPITGGIGAGLLIVILLSGALHDLPLLRVLALPGIVAGLLFAVVLRYWRRSHAPKEQLVMLSLKNDKK